MATPFPRRLVGYGAYNLCFDRLLGKTQDSPYAPDFFAAIRAKNYQRINLVRVICFRHSQKEGHPAGRATPLYLQQGSQWPPAPYKVVVNPAFLGNLSTLARRASETGFWLQISIFHYHAITGLTGNPVPEFPELVPDELKVDAAASPCERLKSFFDPANAARVARQKELVAAVVGATKSYGNVFYEIGNELRLDGPGCTPADNCKLAEWMNIMRGEIYRVFNYVNVPHVGTSTGSHGSGQAANEEEIFAACPRKLVPNYFDFHFGQWQGANVSASMDAAAARARDYLNAASTPPLIINDDGARDLRTLPNVTAWAKTAFQKKFHYASKQPYPNGSGANFDLNVLAALDDAAATTPL